MLTKPVSASSGFSMTRTTLPLPRVVPPRFLTTLNPVAGGSKIKLPGARTELAPRYKRIVVGTQKRWKCALLCGSSKFYS